MSIYGGHRTGKSYANTQALFQNWLVTNFNPVPEGEIVMLMWAAWLESYLVMKQIQGLGKPVKDEIATY